MVELTFLETQQIYGDKALDVIKQRGTKAAITDFAILLGGLVSSDDHVDEYKSLDKRTGWYWTKTVDKYNYVDSVNKNGNFSHYRICLRYGGTRPALVFPSNSLIFAKEISNVEKNGVLEVEYGYYPRSAVPSSMQQKLKKAHKRRRLIKTGNTYTTDSRKYKEEDKTFLSQSHIEYKYEGKRYVRVKANSYYDGSEFILSNGEKYRDGDFVWIEVEPVRWLVDRKSNIMITEEIILAGVQFMHKKSNKSDFENTNIKNFMDNYLTKELFQIQNIEVNKNNLQSTQDANIETQFSELIEKLYKKGYSTEQILFHTADILKKLSNNSENTIIHQKTKHL